MTRGIIWFNEALATGVGDGSPTFANINPLGAETDTIPKLVTKILELVVQIGLPIIVLAIIYAGFLYVKARGNETEVTEAHRTIYYTIIGAAIVLGAAVISAAIKGTIDSLK